MCNICQWLIKEDGEEEEEEKYKKDMNETEQEMEGVQEYLEGRKG